MDDLKPIFDLAAAYDPHGFGYQTFRDVHIPRLWLNNGADIKTDILPIMNQAMKRNGSIKSFLYFDKSVNDAVERKKAIAIANTPAPEDPGKAARIMKNLAWLRDKKPNLLRPEEAAQLKEWEAKNGPVAA